MSKQVANSASLPVHPIHGESKIDSFDVFIAGSGPVGATYARLLVDAGFSVLMTEIGDQDTRLPAEHKKNEIGFQKDIDRFVRVIQGALSTVSIPTSATVVPTLNPEAWTATDPSKMILTNGRNSHQETWNNLGAEAVTRCVGGMSTHWTCATPRFLKGLERPKILASEAEDDAEWNRLYLAAETFVGTSSTQFNHSIRHNIVLEALRAAYPDRNVKPLPLACHRIAEGSPYVVWHAASNIYGDMWTNPDKTNGSGVKRGYFKLLTNTRCTKLHLTQNTAHDHEVGIAEVKDLLAARSTPDLEANTNFAIRAKTYVLAAGAIGTPQILANSNFGGRRPERDASPPCIQNIGTRITEQPMAFCQVVMLKSLVANVENGIENREKWWQVAVEKHKRKHPEDPLPIPFQDPEPQVTIPLTKERPWHTQIHRDAFSYGEVGPRVDSRVVVDLRWFGMQEPDPVNRLIFENDVQDAYGMPQPTFEYLPTDKSALEAHDMMTDMVEVASKIGGYLPGSEPQFMTPGLALHLGGTIRLGQGADLATTVANFNSQIWDFKNLYVAGNGTIPTPFGANPTLTSIGLAIRSAYQIAEQLKANKFNSPNPAEKLVQTPDSWLKWSVDVNDPNYPHHTEKKLPKAVELPTQKAGY